jgi:hypothetical protein
MYRRPVAPRSIGSVLDDAIRLYRASFSRCWGLSLAGAVLVAAASLYINLRSMRDSVAVLSAAAPAISGNTAPLAAAMARLQHVEHTPGQLLAYVLMMLVWLAFHAAIVRRQDASANGREDSAAEAVSFAVRHLPELVVGGIVYCVIIVVGFIFLVVPGVWLWGCLQLWLIALCVEGLGPFAALGRSWRLIERNWWRTSTTVGVAWIIILVVSLVDGVLVGVFGVFLRSDPTAVILLAQLLGVILSVFTTPMLTVAMLEIFYDLKLRREGGDLAARMNSL